MSTPGSDEFPLSRALAISVGLHLIFAAMFAVAPNPYLGSAVPDTASPNEVTHVAYLTIEQRTARSIGSHLPVAVAMKKAPAVVPASNVHRLLPPKGSMNAMVRLPVHPHKAVVDVTSKHATGRIALALALAAREDEPPLPATAQPTPSARRVDAPPVNDSANPSAGSIDVPNGGWGNSFAKPIVADDDAIADLRAKYHPVAIAVDVDETGRATRVVVPANLADDIRAELERRLLEMRYVPAECNGLRCTGSLQFTL